MTRCSDKCTAAKFPLSRGSRGCLWSRSCRSRACHCSTSKACEEPSQVAAVVGEEEQAFSEFLPVGGFLQCFPELVASSPGWSGTRIWLPLYCNTSTTRGLVCLTQKERFFFCLFLCFSLPSEFGKSRVISKGFLLMSWGRVPFSKRTFVLK